MFHIISDTIWMPYGIHHTISLEATKVNAFHVQCALHFENYSGHRSNYLDCAFVFYVTAATCKAIKDHTKFIFIKIDIIMQQDL